MKQINEKCSESRMIKSIVWLTIARRQIIRQRRMVAALSRHDRQNARKVLAGSVRATRHRARRALDGRVNACCFFSTD